METLRDHDITPEEAALVAAEREGGADHDLASPLRALGPTCELDLDFTDRVMARIRGTRETEPWWRRMWVRVRRPVSSRSAVLAAVPIGVGVVLVTLFVFRHSTLLASKPAAGPVYVASDLYPVEFRLAAPGATRVNLAGDFNRWRSDSIPLAGPDRHGVWTVTLTLAPGRYAYQFVIDGKERVVDPRAEVDRTGHGPRSILRL